MTKASLPHYPPFGSSLPNRTWSDANRGYRFGFNGKEKDSETASDNFDFGARIYDGRLGRWLSLDPLMKKYPSTNPYNYTSNNPVLYIDLNGQDYGIYINHETNTIIIRATFHTIKGDDANRAYEGVNFWNKQNQFEYIVGENLVKYKIEFQLSVKEHENIIDRQIAFENSLISGESNKFLIVPSRPELRAEAYGESQGGINTIVAESSEDASRSLTYAHEIGHTLGLGHWIDGNLMQSGGTFKGEENNKITVGMVSKILVNDDIGQLIETDQDKQAYPTNGEAKVATKNIIGVAPIDFCNGKVITK